MDNNEKNKDTGKISVSIKYGTKDLKEIINGIIINYFFKTINNLHI